MRRTAVVSGGGSGIGRAICHALSAEAWVAALDLKFGASDSFEGRRFEVDVTDRDAVDQVSEEIVAERGGVDWLVCAAGIIRDRVSWKMLDREWDQVLAVNLTGAFNLSRRIIPHIRRSDRGRVVLISSINGIRGRFGQANYAASKAGLIGLGRTLAAELARDGGTANVIAPGYIETPMTQGLPQEVRERAVARTPLGRLGSPEEIAATVNFICSQGAGFITGAVIPVDGGQLLGQVN